MESYFSPFLSTYYEFYSKVTARAISFPQPATSFCARLGKSSSWLDPPACIAPNPITQDAEFQCFSDTPLSKSSPCCVKSIRGAWRICAPLGFVVQKHAGVYDALGRQRLFLRLSYLQNQSPPRVLLFQFVFVLQSTYLKHSVQPQLCGCDNEVPMPRNFSPCLLWVYNWTLFLQVCARSYSPIKKLSFVHLSNFATVLGSSYNGSPESLIWAQNFLWASKAR